MQIDFTVERAILKIGNRLNNLRTDDLKEYELTVSQSETLLYFAEHTGATVSELKTYLQISHQAARNIVERLKERRLLFTTTSKTDARANTIFLTDEGKNLYDKLKSSGSSVGSRLLRNLSDTEKQELLRLLLLITENMDC